MPSGTEYAQVVGEEGGGKPVGGSMLIASSVVSQLLRHTVSSIFDDGKPSLAAQVDPDPGSAWTQTILRAYTAASRTWLLSGTNATSALCTLNAKGGITLTTAGASNDQMICAPLVINSVDMSPMGRIDWSPEYQPNFKAILTLGSSIADQRIIVGCKLTSVHEDHDSGATITDANYALFVYDTTHSSNSGYWHACVGVAGSDYNSTADGTRARRALVRAGDRVVLEIKVDNNRVPHFYIDGNLVYSGPEMETALSLIPVVGIQALAASAKELSILTVELSQNV